MIAEWRFAWRVAQYLRANRDALLADILRAQFQGMPVTWSRNALQGLFVLLTRSDNA